MITLLIALLFFGEVTFYVPNTREEAETDRLWLAARRAEPPELITSPATVRFTQSNYKGRRSARAKLWFDGKWRTPICNGPEGTRLYFDEKAVLQTNSMLYFDREVSITYNKRTLRSDRLWLDLCGTFKQRPRPWLFCAVSRLSRVGLY